jgi:transposase-like protein|tara:strand:+ start:505 stop:726 length:222 start_codon:yes stop_codon:yes gene_type:complete
MQGTGEKDVLKKLAPPYNLSVPELSQQEGISVGALCNWRSQARLRGAPVPAQEKHQTISLPKQNSQWWWKLLR